MFLGDAVQLMCKDCDGNSFGHQIIKDKEVEFDTFWYNYNSSEYDPSPHSWLARIKAKKSENTVVSFIVYFTSQVFLIILKYFYKIII